MPKTSAVAKKTVTPDLPVGIIKTDTAAPRYHPRSNMALFARTDGYGNITKDKYGPVASFELWYTTGFGWCIPTLLISKAGSRRSSGTADRTYAVRVSDGSTVRIGLGPHVLHQTVVHIKKSRLPALQKFLDLRQSGAGRAGEIRDRISTRRAQGAMRRGVFF